MLGIERVGFCIGPLPAPAGGPQPSPGGLGPNAGVPFGHVQSSFRENLKSYRESELSLELGFSQFNAKMPISHWENRANASRSRPAAIRRLSKRGSDAGCLAMRTVRRVARPRAFRLVWRGSMRISELLRTRTPVFSFEFFPPKTAQGEYALFQTIEQLRSLEPGFVSVTYGAGGTTREKTVELVTRIRHEIGIEAMAHLTCVANSRAEIRAILDRLQHGGIENVLALRGDPPRDQPHFQPPPDGFRYASELVRFIRAEGFAFCLGGACYPEGHIEAPDLETDLRHLREKVDAGLDFLISQLFFDNRFFFSFEQRARARGITLPIVPGIMPITNVAQIERFTQMCGATIPPELHARLREADGNADAVRQIGIEHALQQCRELLRHGVAGVHFYTLNQSPATRAIVERLREERPWQSS